MKYKTIKHLLDLLSHATTEKEVKHAYVQHFGLKLKTSFRHDLYSEQVLFEFKFNKALTHIKARSEVVAQVLYYIRRLRLGQVDKPIPPIICVADINEAFFTDTILWRPFYIDKSNKYDWEKAPSTPDQKLVEAISQTPSLLGINIYKTQEVPDYIAFSEKLRGYLSGQLELPITEKKIIDSSNFVEVYDYWSSIFSEDVKNSLKTSKYFLCDIQDGKSVYKENEGKVIFDFGQEKRSKKIIQTKYFHFWSLYEKIANPDTIRNIITKLDCLTDIPTRRFTGEFFTPPKFANKAIDYFSDILGKNWWNDENVRIWDMASGTGNLEWGIPYQAYHNIYLTTLYKEDVDYCKKLFPHATCFQYDYLNDDINKVIHNRETLFDGDWKLPDNLRKDLDNPKLHWVIFINPPFATSQEAGAKGRSKKDVSGTAVRHKMHEDNLGEVSRELFAQFLYRIKHEFAEKRAHLGLFSKIKYLNANNDQKFRDSIFKFTFEKGFIFSSANFSGTSKSSQFPVGFIIWNLSESKRIEDQNIFVDIFDEDVYRIGKKAIPTENRERFLNKWIERPAANIIFPPFGSSINVKKNNLDARDRISEGFLASLMCKGNDFVNQNYTSILSGPYVSAGALSITNDNFEKAMIIHAVRKIPKATWINDRDQFMQPDKELKSSFITDCIVWSLFSGSNETVSLRNVEYKGTTYQIINHFFPFRIQDISAWEITDTDIKKSINKDLNDRFVSIWLDKHDLSQDSKDILHIAKRIYKSYFNNLHKLPTSKYKIEWWDAGWWQIRNSLSSQNIDSFLFEELKTLQNSLKDKLLPQIMEYGFIL
jgi:hypothetical protein